MYNIIYVLFKKTLFITLIIQLLVILFLNLESQNINELTFEKNTFF